jgi:hypothetical protein
MMLAVICAMLLGSGRRGIGRRCIDDCRNRRSIRLRQLRRFTWCLTHDHPPSASTLEPNADSSCPCFAAN